MKNNDYQNIKDELLKLGYDNETISSALNLVKIKNVENCLEYIHMCKIAKSEINRRKTFSDAREIASIDCSNQKKIEAVQKTRDEYNKSNDYFEYTKQRLNQEKKENEEYKKGSKTLIVIPNKDKIIDKVHDCQIRVRFNDGSCELFIFQKDEIVDKLFMAIKKKYNGGSFKIYNIRKERITNKSETMMKMGFYPTAILFAKKS